MTVGELSAAAEDVLRKNDRGGYTVPCPGLYPHQWNWDSALAALGWAHIDRDRAWLEIETLVAAQSRDGMIAHIAFNPEVTDYRPGPDWWGERYGTDGRRLSGISHPPITATCLRVLIDKYGDIERARPLLPRLLAWHRWYRDVRGSGSYPEPVIVHPHETGRDNSIEWDGALDRADDCQRPLERADTTFVDADHRPTKAHYLKYLGLWEAFGRLDWDQKAMAERSPFRMLAPDMSSMLASACADLAALARDLDEPDIAQESNAQALEICNALDTRRDGNGLAWPIDLAADDEVHSLTCTLALEILAPSVPQVTVDRIAALVIDGALASPAGVRSTAATEVGFQSHNYWRGPAWSNVTWLVALGLERHGRADAAALLRRRIIDAVRETGFCEYWDPETGEGLGARDFSWSAALALDCLRS